MLEGTVVDDRGPVAGVTIKAIAHGKELGALTGAKGHFRLTGTAPGKYRIYPAKDGYEGGEDGDLQNAIRLDLAVGAHIKDADFVIHQAASISGRILDSNRKPVQAAVVVLFAKRFSGHRWYLQTVAAVSADPSGSYVLKSIRAGTYYLSANFPVDDSAGRPSGPHEPKVAPVRTYYPNATSFENAAPIYLGRAEQREGFDLIINQALAFCVTGKFVAAFGEDPIWARFTVAQLVGSNWAGFIGFGDAKPGEDFEVCDLPSGAYAVSILAMGKDQVARLASRPFTIVNRDVAVGELSVGPPERLRGKMVVSGAPDDSPFPTGVRVEVRSLNRPDPFAGEGLVGQARSTGEFSIENLFSDDYSLRVTGLPRGYYVQTIFQAGRDAANHPIRPGDDLTITLSSDGPVVSGESLDKDNVPVHGATVILIPKDPSLSSIVSVRSGRVGRFQFQSGIAPGEYSIVALTGLFDGEDQDPDFVRDQMTRATPLALDKKETKSLRLVVHDAHQP